MKARDLALVFCLWILSPLDAHASSFALVLYPLGALTAMVISALLFARGKRTSIRVSCVVIAALTAACGYALPTEFYSSSLFQNVASWIGDWAFFLLALAPALLVAFIALKLAGYAISGRDA